MSTSVSSSRKRESPRASCDIFWRQKPQAMPFAKKRITLERPRYVSRSTSGPWADGNRSDGACCPTTSVMVSSSTQERQDEEGVAGPAGGFLHGPALGEPSLGFLLEIALDRERGEPLVARHQELRFTDRLGDREGPSVVVLTALVVAAALVDLPQDDQRHRQVVLLAEVLIELDRGDGRPHALV